MAAKNDSQTAGSGAELLKQYWHDAFINEVKANLVMKNLGLQGSVPKNMGLTVHWARMFRPSDATTAISEGFDPSATVLSTADITAALTQYGAYTPLTDVLKDTSLVQTMKNVMERLGFQAAKSIDTIIRDVIFGGSVVQYGGSAVARNSIPADSTFYLDVDELREARNTLERADVPRYKDDYYRAIVHPDSIYDLQGDTKWTDLVKYTSPGVQGKGETGETGAIYGYKVLSTSQAPILTNSGSASTEIYQTLCLGPEYFGVSDLYDVQTIVKDPSPVSVLDLYSTAGWKAMFAVKRLDSTRAVRIEHSTFKG